MFRPHMVLIGDGITSLTTLLLVLELLPTSARVLCGGHYAEVCAECPPPGHGAEYCNGECHWDDRARQCMNGTKLSTYQSPAATPFRQIAQKMGFMNKMRSEPEPAPGALYTGAIRNLVGTTFADAVNDKTKDVFLLVYAPWCGHCQKFKPSYQKLARHLQHVNTLAITQIDGTQNEVPFPVSGFPTLALFPAGQEKKYIYYPGDRSPEDMQKWLHNYVTHSFTDTPAPELQGQNAPPDSGLLTDSEDDL
eukprot:gnl/MRDRNA2_/MRDRNA2_73190_c0_seq4.p1 gnl/MRDRNA2_/MRDRNA2_73190_c0~~gnl/MRDRNA2_/MRDRNA2_73190_c0_seq4.p1  ORF type:complete len:250 (-),score=26.20 gnl/MRDRNA2_/MRDRNA2_73190_c0_seq4:17-766(-)